MEFAGRSRAAAMSLSKQIVCSPRASERIEAARAWIGSIAPGTEALVVAASHEAADDLLREFTVSRGATFGVHRLTLNRLIGVLAAEHMVNAGLAPAAGLAAEAVAARAVFRLKPTGRLGTPRYFWRSATGLRSTTLLTWRLLPAGKYPWLRSIRICAPPRARSRFNC